MTAPRSALWPVLWPNPWDREAPANHVETSVLDRQVSRRARLNISALVVALSGGCLVAGGLRSVFGVARSIPGSWFIGVVSFAVLWLIGLRLASEFLWVDDARRGYRALPAVMGTLVIAIAVWSCAAGVTSGHAIRLIRGVNNTAHAMGVISAVSVVGALLSIWGTLVRQAVGLAVRLWSVRAVYAARLVTCPCLLPGSLRGWLVQVLDRTDPRFVAWALHDLPTAGVLDLQRGGVLTDLLSHRSAVVREGALLAIALPQPARTSEF